jgi:2'-5' RNA ligase
MQKEIRTFVAIKIVVGEEIKNQLDDFKQIFKSDKIRWVDPDNFHLTLRFIGNTTREQLYSLVDGFEEVVKTIECFPLRIKGSGYFNSKGKPRVVFVKIDDSEPLIALVKAIEQVVVEYGFNEELKSFRPHLTLGRIKHLDSRTKFYSIVEELKDLSYQNVDVSEFVIYQSILKPEGPEYKPIKTFKLK